MWIYVAKLFIFDSFLAFLYRVSNFETPGSKNWLELPLANLATKFDDFWLHASFGRGNLFKKVIARYVFDGKKLSNYRNIFLSQCCV
jgi:hypothetical protein